MARDEGSLILERGEESGWNVQEMRMRSSRSGVEWSGVERATVWTINRYLS